MTLPLLETISVWALGVVKAGGLGGIFLTQALESALIPIPSEIVLPFGGFLAQNGDLSLTGVILAASFGNLAGGLVTYWLGLYYGRGFVERYGRYFLIGHRDIQRLDSLSERYGSWAALLTRLLPGIRTVSSLGLGIARIPLKPFVAYTFIGSVIWNFALAYIGYIVGVRWDFLRPYFKKAEYVILGLILISVIIFIHKHRRRQQSSDVL